MYHSSLGKYILLFSSSCSFLYLICSEASVCLKWKTFYISLSNIAPFKAIWMALETKLSEKSKKILNRDHPFFGTPCSYWRKPETFWIHIADFICIGGLFLWRAMKWSKTTNPIFKRIAVTSLLFIAKHAT